MLRIVAAGLAFAALSMPAAAQDVTLVMPTDNVGAPTYDVFKATLLNIANYLIYDRLVVADEHYNYFPGLAMSWEDAPDGMRWTFHLKPGVKFHDGEPFNADTVKWWVGKYRSTENNYLVDAIGDVTVVDPLTVRFDMKRPDPNLLFSLTTGYTGIPAPQAYERLGKDYGVTGAVGTGPFMLQSFTVGQQTVLRRNPDYAWGPATSENRGPAKVETLTIREIADQSTAFLELQTGGVDGLLSVPLDFVARLQAQPNMAMITQPGSDVMYMAFNTARAPFDDPKVREAAALAIDQKSILQNMYHGIGQEAHSFLISSLKESDIGPDAISFDPARARHVLDTDGWALGPDGVRQKNGQKLEVALWTQSDTEFRRVTEVVQAQLAAVGIKGDISVLDAAAIKAEFRKGMHQLVVRSYNWANADILDWFYSAHRLGYPNLAMWNNPESERLNDVAMHQSKTPAERVANFIAYHRNLASQFTFAPIYQPVTTVTYNKDRIRLPASFHAPSFQAPAALMMEIAP